MLLPGLGYAGYGLGYGYGGYGLGLGHAVWKREAEAEPRRGFYGRGYGGYGYGRGRYGKRSAEAEPKAEADPSLIHGKSRNLYHKQSTKFSNC